MPRSPEEIERILDERADTITAAFAAKARGVHPRRCPLCQYQGPFSAFGDPPRYDARCPNCSSLERHRLIHLTLRKHDLLRDDVRMLHFAPEYILRARYMGRVKSYESADLSPRAKVDHVVDITATGLPRAAYDLIMCNHVLEHVDDAAALLEMFELLVPGGTALLTTPVVEGWHETYEEEGDLSPARRRLVFGQADHVRLYGRDIRARIRAAGFRLEENVATEPEVSRHGLIRGETVFLARKPE